MFLKKKYIMDNLGICPICETEVRFLSKNEWLRDHYLCTNCGSIPRERALMDVIKNNYSDWKNAVIHETSPGNRGASVRLGNECKKYILSSFI